MPRPPRDPCDVASDLLERAGAAHAAGRLASARTLARRALSGLEAALPPGDVNIAPALTTLAQILSDQGDTKAAATLFRRAVRILARAEGDPDADALRVEALLTLSHMERAAGRYARAEPHAKAALDLAHRRLGRSSVAVATALNERGVICKYTARFEEGLRFYRRALRIAERASGAEGAAGAGKSGSDLVATILHNLGGIEHAARRFRRALPFAQRSVEVRTRLHGADHPSVAADEAALAAILDGLGRFDESEPLYERALAVFRRAYGPVHYEVAVNLHNLAAVRERRGDAAGARRLYRRALALEERLLGRDHPDVAETLNNLGVLEIEQGRPERARPLLLRALGIFEQALGKRHPSTRACRGHLAAVDGGLRSPRP